MMDLSGYVKKPCIRLEPNGSEPAAVYCKKYAAVYQSIVDQLNGGKPVGSFIHDRSGMDLLYVGVAEDGQINFSGHEIESVRRLNPITGQYEKGLARARPFSVLEKIANEAGFIVRVEIAQPFVESKYGYQPKKEDGILYGSCSVLELARSTSQNQASTAIARPNFTALVLAAPVALQVKRGRTSDTLEMPKPANPESRLIGYGNHRCPDTLVANRSEPIPQESQLSQGSLN